MKDDKTTINEIKKKVEEHIQERDWEQFHNPKDVAIALSIEAAEILEIFRWKTPEQMKELLSDPKIKEDLGDELADVLSFIVDLARVTDIDLAEAFERKMEKNNKKYPKELVKGKNHKYTYYQKK
jgi:NTP pyrophosphatase (non-canonical NTP hydrolase)